MSAARGELWRRYDTDARDGDESYVEALASGWPEDNDKSFDFDKDVRNTARQYRVNDAARERNRKLTGQENVFSEVDWDAVDTTESIPLDEDGVFLISMIHWISGAPGSGKTILAYWKLVRRAKRKQHSAIYECEMGEALAKGLLRNLGATDVDLRYIHYYKAAEDGTVVNLVRNGRAFCAMLVRLGYMTLVYDALNPLLVAAGLNENVASDVRAWVLASCHPLALAGGMVIVIDHVGKENSAQSRGSSDKPAAGHVDLVLRQTSAFARCVVGKMELTCNKDRTGTMIKGSRLTIDVEARGDGSLRLKPDIWTWELQDAEPRQRGGHGGPTQQKIIEFGRGIPEGFTIGEAVSATGLTRKAIESSLARGSKPDDNGEIVFSLVRRGLWKVA